MDSPTIVFKYFNALNSIKKEQIEALGTLYSDWNEKINLISRKDLDHLYLRHVLHSLGIAKVIQFKPGTVILDVGTGGGFPGIPLAILFPDTRFHLVDSIGKKILVVKNIAKDLGLENIVAEQKRAENVQGTFDFVVSRAVTKMKPFRAWVDSKFNKVSFNSLKNGILYLKGGDLDAEMQELNLPCKSFNLSVYFVEEFFETKKIIHLPG